MGPATGRWLHPLVGLRSKTSLANRFVQEETVTNEPGFCPVATALWAVNERGLPRWDRPQAGGYNPLVGLRSKTSLANRFVQEETVTNGPSFCPVATALWAVNERGLPRWDRPQAGGYNPLVGLRSKTPLNRYCAPSAPFYAGINGR